MDTIVISDLEVSYRIGVSEAERAQPQRLLVTIELGHEFTAAAAADDLRETIDYYAVVQRLLRFGDHRAWRLLETLAGDIAELLRAEFGAKSVSVEIKKFILPETRHVAVRVRRP